MFTDEEEDYLERLRCSGCYDEDDDDDDELKLPEERMSDKRTVATDALETLGTIIDETAGRDAIHLAVEPVVANHQLHAGEHVGRMEDGTFSRFVEPTLGIVDPFLKLPIEKGERFWLVVYPRQITSLRHCWTHPAFPEVVTKPTDRAASEAWLRNFADTTDAPSYEEMIAASSYCDGTTSAPQTQRRDRSAERRQGNPHVSQVRQLDARSELAAKGHREGVQKPRKD